MTRLLHVADSYLGVDPFRSETRAEDVWQGFERSIDAAIEHNVDVYLHAGMLISEFAQLRQVLPRLRGGLARLAAAGIDVVVHQTHHDLAGLDVDVVCAGDDPLLVRGVRFAEALDCTAPAPLVVVQHGRVAGMGGLEPGIGEVAPEAVLASSASYVAFSGANRWQAVQPTAWYSGQTARVDLRDLPRPGGLIVDLDEVGVVRRIERVRWPDRQHLRVVVEGTGLASAQLVDIVEERLGAALGQPAVSLHVWRPAVSLDAALAGTDGRLGFVLQRALYAQVRWGDERRLFTQPSEPG